MENLIQIDTGVKRIKIQRDGQPAGEIVFNPSDGLFAEKFYQLIGELDAKKEEYQARADEIESNQASDANGIALTTPLKLEMMREACEYLKGRIDYVFGAGTSAVVFGDAINLDVFSQFFAGITPYIQEARSGKVAQYISPPPPPVPKRRKHK